MKYKLCVVGIVLILASAGAVYAESAKTLRLATTTSVDNSGLLDFLLPEFKKDYPYDVTVTVVGSGKALRLGRSGAVDVVWVHSPASERKFVDEGFGVSHKTVMRNDFILAGPVDDPAQISSEKNIHDALKKIASAGTLFVSRGDDSGTNKKELSLWDAVGVDPVGEDWYLETGQGMGASLKTAQQNKAYIMIDRATFVVRHDASYKIVLEDEGNLSNPYSVMAVNPTKQKAINFQAAINFIDWLDSPRGKLMIAAFKHDDEQLYFPAD